MSTHLPSTDQLKSSPSWGFLFQPQPQRLQRSQLSAGAQVGVYKWLLPSPMPASLLLLAPGALFLAPLSPFALTSPSCHPAQVWLTAVTMQVGAGREGLGGGDRVTAAPGVFLWLPVISPSQGESSSPLIKPQPLQFLVPTAAASDLRCVSHNTLAWISGEQGHSQVDLRGDTVETRVGEKCRSRAKPLVASAGREGESVMGCSIRRAPLKWCGPRGGDGMELTTSRGQLAARTWGSQFLD